MPEHYKETENFAKAASLMLNKYLQDGCTNKGLLDILRAWSEKKCCGAKRISHYRKAENPSEPAIKSS